MKGAKSATGTTSGQIGARRSSAKRGGIPVEIRRRMSDLDGRILHAREIPLEAMADLIDLLREAPMLMDLVVERFRRHVRSGALGACWLGIVLGESKGDVVDEALLWALGLYGELLDETVGPCLMHRGSSLLERVVSEIEKTTDDHRRGWLYDLLESMLLAEDESVRERLRPVVRHRWSVERGARSVEMRSVLRLMVALDEPDVRDLLSEARRICEPGSELERELGGVEMQLRGELPLAGFAREVADEGWRESARRIGVLAGMEPWAATRRRDS